MTRIRADVLPVFTVSKNFVDLSPVGVTDVETSATFPRQMKSVLIYNNGTDSIHWATIPGVSTNNFILPAGSSISMVFPITSLFFICAATETATIYLIGED